MADPYPTIIIAVDRLSVGATAWVRDWAIDIALNCDDAICDGVTFRARYFDADSGYGEAVSGMMAPLNGLARHEPMLAFGGVSNRQVSVSFALAAESGNDAFNRQVVNPIRWLDALRYPTAFGPPPAVRLSIGTNLSLRCVMSSLSVEMQGPFDGTGTPAYAQVSLTFLSLGVAGGARNSAPRARRNQAEVGGVNVNYKGGSHAAEV